MAEDFNTVRALAAVYEWVREANRSAPPIGDRDLREMLDVLGLANLLDVEEVEVQEVVQALLEAREQARANRDWARADQIRDELKALGWEIRDSADGPRLLPTR